MVKRSSSTLISTHWPLNSSLNFPLTCSKLWVMKILMKENIVEKIRNIKSPRKTLKFKKKWAVSRSSFWVDSGGGYSSSVRHSHENSKTPNISSKKQERKRSGNKRKIRESKLENKRKRKSLIKTKEKTTPKTRKMMSNKPFPN